MNKTFLTIKLTPVIAIILCCILYASGYFQMIAAAFILIIASVAEYKKNAFSSLGFLRENIKVKNLLVIAPIVGTVIFLFYYYLLMPTVTYFTGEPIDFTVFEPYKGNLPETLNLFVRIWISAAFAEEIVFRGYLMRLFTKFFGSSNISLVINILLLGLIFGLTHTYQGISGIFLSGITGMILAIIFHIRKNDLWFNIAVHGFIDMVFLIYLYYGWF